MNGPTLKPPAASAPQTSQNSPAPARHSWMRWLKWVVLVAICLVIVYAVIVRPLMKPADNARNGSRTPAVIAEPARKTNLNVRISSLGTITPVNTVTVRSRVDGQLQKLLFEEGQPVETGAPLAEIDPRPFEAQKQQAEAMLAKDNTLLENARVDFERFKALLTDNSISRQQYDTQQALVRQYESAVKLDQAQVETAALQLSYAHITAPISGRTGLRLVDTGNMIHSTDSNGIVVITQLHPITVVFSIPQDALPQILKRFKTNETITIEAYDRDGKTLLATGKLITIDNQIDPSTGTVKLRGEFANDDETLFPNQFVNVQLISDTIENATVVSNAAVQRGAAGTYVYLVTDQDGQKTVSVRPIETNTAERNIVSVTKGLVPGDLVVVDGVDKLRDGSTVTLVSRDAGSASGSDAKNAKSGRPGGKRQHDGAKPQQN